MKNWVWLWLALLCAGGLLGDEPDPVKIAAKDQVLRVPAGFRAADGTPPEPYTKTGWAKEIVHEQTGMAMVYVPAGEFEMGSPAQEKERADNETAHRVTLTKAFYLGKYEVTQGQWEKVMGHDPSLREGAGADTPVDFVSWNDCQAFIAKLNATLRSEPGTVHPLFRLPTEAEWEYACRAGTRGPFHYGDSLEASQANFDGNYPYGNRRKGEYRKKPLPVGSFKPNAWGLYDMHGNLWEWCSDWHGEYPTGAVSDPVGPASGQQRVSRGGSWVCLAEDCRSARRYGTVPEGRMFDLGCRLALSPAIGQR